MDASGSVYVGGIFTQVGGRSRNRIAKLSGSGTGIVDPDWNPSANDEVSAIDVDIDGAVYVGGYFTEIGTRRHASFAAFNSVQLTILIEAPPEELNAFGASLARYRITVTNTGFGLAEDVRVQVPVPAALSGIA